MPPHLDSLWLQTHFKRHTSEPRSNQGICNARSLGDAQMAAREMKRHNKENKEKAVREVTAAERTAVEKYLARREAKPPSMGKSSEHDPLSVRRKSNK
jgi:hypothetical protein